MDVVLTKIMSVAVIPPTVTVVLGVKPVPVKVTKVPPVTEPELGTTEVSVGALARYVYPPGNVALPRPLLMVTSLVSEPLA